MRDLDLRKHLDAFAATISSQRIGLALHRPESWAQPTFCFENIRRKVEQDGGRRQFGWMFHCRIVLDIPGPGYFIAVHHAVWHAPDDRLIDITPFHTDSKHHPLRMEGGVIFLIDDAATLPPFAPRPSCFYALDDDERLAAHLERLTREEEQRCREIDRRNRELSATKGK
jgi:hypothetical protein